jgi:hypothetical protein
MTGIEILFQLAAFLDLRVVTAGDDFRLIVFERGDQYIEATDGPELLQTKWHIWAPAPNPVKCRKLGESVVFLPGIKSVDPAVVGEELYALVESNVGQSLYMVRWPMPGGVPDSVTAPAAEMIGLAMDESRAEQVELGPNEEWSTRGLQPRQWLFNPSVAIGKDGAVSVAANTATSDIVLLERLPGATEWREAAFLPGALEPALCEIDGHRLMAFRRPAGRWIVKRKSRHYAFGAPQVAMPFELVEIKGGSASPDGLAKPFGTEATYIFDFADDGQKRLAVATVSGPQSKPMLTINISDDLCRTWQKKGAFFLEAVPERLSLAVTSKEAVVGMAFLQKDAYQIAVVRCGL